LQPAKHEIKRARALETGDILEKFVDEMHRWAKACAEVLETLRET
jgi:Holliday junction resolvasome RuvABC ATP-dependent DNA helicase subunit